MRLRKILFVITTISIVAVGCKRQYDPAVAIGEKEISNEKLAKKPIDDFQTLAGTVIGIMDGDTFKMLVSGNKEIKIRLEGIDAPEKKQAFSNRSKQALSKLVFNKSVLVKYKTKDRYRRIIGIVYTDNKLNVNEEMIRSGMAWHFKKYSNSKIYAELENQARARRIGLWSDKNPIAPWDYRKN